MKKTAIVTGVTGGIAVDMWWQSSVKGLFCAGECADTNVALSRGGCPPEEEICRAQRQMRDVAAAIRKNQNIY